MGYVFSVKHLKLTFVKPRAVVDLCLEPGVGVPLPGLGVAVHGSAGLEHQVMLGGGGRPRRHRPRTYNMVLLCPMCVECRFYNVYNVILYKI